MKSISGLKAAAAAAMMVVFATSASAATIDFDVTLIDSVGGGTVETGTASLTYDESLLTPTGGTGTIVPDGSFLADPFLDTFADPSLSFSVTFATLTLTEMDDLGFPDFPNFGFDSGVIVDIFFLQFDDTTLDPFSSLDLISALGVSQIFTEFGSVGDLNASGNYDLTLFSTPGNMNVIPLPTSALLLLSAVGVGAVVGRKRKA